MKCIICSKEMTARFAARDYRRPSIPQEWPVRWCTSCEFGRVDAELTPSEVSEFYAVEYYTHNSEGTHSLPRTLADKIRTHLAWRLDFGRDLDPDEIDRNPDAVPTLCDLGCGNGHLLRLFKSFGYRVTGVEPDEKALALAAAVGPVYQGTAEQLPAAIQDSRYDVVMLSHVLEHCIDPVAAIKNSGQILSRDGTLVIEVPNNKALGFERLGPGWPWSDIPRHLSFFTLESLTGLLERCGLQVKKVMHTGFTRQFSPDWLKTQDLIAERIGTAKHGDHFAWTLLLSSVFAGKARKYDSLRVHAHLRH